MSLLDDLLAILIPHLCLGCQAEGGLLCVGCRNALPGVAVDQHAYTHIQRVRAVTEYRGVAKDLLWKLKSGGAQAAARVIAECMAPLVVPRPESVIVPVPTATTRIRQRGYDQVGLLAKELSRSTALPVYNYLTRSGQAHQVGSNRVARLTQMDAAFRAKASQSDSAHIILIDDVTTTGATLEAAAKALRLAGVSRIEGLVFAYAVQSSQTKNKPKAMP